MKSKIYKRVRSRFTRFCHTFLIFLWIEKFIVCDSSGNFELLNSEVDGLITTEALAKTQITTTGQTANKTTEIFSDYVTNYGRPSVSKCCNINYGFTFENKSNCVESKDKFLPDFENLPEYTEKAKVIPVDTRYEYFIGDPCTDGKYILDLTLYPDDKYSIYSNGTLLYLDQLYSKSEYCLETLNGTIRAFICFVDSKNDYKKDFTFILYAVGLIISIPFLVATAIIYLSTDSLRDLRGKSLSCHVLCLATGYFFLALVQLASDELNEEICIAAGFIIQFFFVAAFFWLNVMCYDTWRCINNDFTSTYKSTNLSPKQCIFYYYFCYGWYGPLILSVVSLIMDLEPAIPESFLKPNFGLKSCWFHSDDAALPYFYGPVGIMICINIVFFILSSRKICLEKKNHVQATLYSGLSVDETRDKFLTIKLYTKTLQECVYLFCIMGINWTAEIISWAVGGSQTIWLITDLFNVLQGIMIFYLFVLKPNRVRNKVKYAIRKTWKKVVHCNCIYKEEN